MGNNELDFNSESLRASGTGLSDTADQLGQRWQQHDADVKGMGEMFGDDMVGSLIGMSYQTAHEMAGESFTSAIDELGFHGEGLQVMADNYDYTEQGISADMDSISKEL